MTALVAPAVLVLSAPAWAAVVPTTNPQAVADAITAPGATTAAFAPLAGPAAAGVGTTPLAGFPTSGATYGVLSTGDVSVADSPNSSPNTTTSWGTSQVRGTDTVFDLTVLEMKNILVPDNGCRLEFRYRYLSEEFPEFVGSGFNDVFVAELDGNTWTSSGGTISAPNAFAVASVNASAMTAANASGTTYDGATALLTASTPISAGTHTVYLSIGDLGDSGYDSTVFVDGMRVVCGPPTFPPGHITIHRFPVGTRLLAAPSGWACFDINNNAPVTVGATLAEPNAGVSCTPPDVSPFCRSVTAGGYHAAAGLGTLTVKSSCGGLSVSQSMTLPFSNPGVSNTVTGLGAFPWLCVTNNLQISADADYWVFCHVNIP